MELKDFVITPIVLSIVYVLAYIIRPKVTDHNTRRYFIPALTVKIIGAIALGLVYQFYYGGGDTFNYHTHGSRHIWEAFMDNPINGVNLIFANGEFIKGTYEYASRIYFYRDPSSYMVIRFAAVFDILTFSTYSATAIFFGALSFSGIWALYQMFYQKYREIHLYLAIAVLFIPSVFFWGSGILKDTLTMAALGWATYAVNKALILKRSVIKNLLIISISIFLLFWIKKYILLCFLPAAILWVFLSYIGFAKSLIMKFLVAPVVLTLCCFFAYLAINKVGEDDPRYSLEKLPETARITAYDIAFYSGKDAGSTYTLGRLDNTFLGLFKLAPSAINVSLFRPYVWEVRNLLMVLTSVESLIFALLTTYLVYICVRNGRVYKDSVVVFCFVFSIVFAFAVGVSTYNFGTLARYKIPLLPYYAAMLSILLYKSKRNRNSYSLNR